MTLGQRRWRAFRANRRGFVSLILFAALFVLSLFAEVIAHEKPILVLYKGELYFPLLTKHPETAFGGTFTTEADYKDPFIVQKIEAEGFMLRPPIGFHFGTINYALTTPAPAPPSAENWLGTDDQGRDVLARLIYGFRLSVLFGLCLTALSSVIGVLLGALQGYFGGRIDLFCQRFLEIWGGLPQLFILILVSSLFTPSFFSLLCVLVLFSWTSLVGVVRAEFLKARKLDYVRAARALGVPDVRIALRHVLPNAMVASLTYVPFILSGSVVALTALDFLGIGLPPGSASLGDLLRQGKENLQAPWLGLSGFAVVSLLLTLLIFIGEAVRDAFDPRKVQA